MPKIKILHLNHLGGKTGSARLMETIISGLPSAEFESHALVGYNFWSEPHTKSVFQTVSGWLYRNLRYKWAVWLNFYLDIMTPWCIDMEYLRWYSPYIDADIVHLHCIQGGYFDWRILWDIAREKKIMMTLHDDWIVSGNDRENLFHPYKTYSQYMRRKRNFEKCDITYIWVSDWITDKLNRDQIHGDNTVKTIYNGIDTTIFSPGNQEVARQLLGLPQDKKIIISIAGSGGKSNAKWLQYVNRIIERYKDNPEYLFITLWNFTSKELSHNLLEIWYISPDMVANYFRAADVFLYPTLMDSFGLIIAESLACWCPVVTFQTGWTAEIVMHKMNGYVAKHRDYDDLLIGFEWCMNMDRATDITLDEQFHKENMIKKYQAEYRYLIRK